MMGVIEGLLLHIDTVRLALLFGIALAAIILGYFLSKFLNSPSFDAKIKEEMANFIWNIIIMVAILPSIIFLDQLYDAAVKDHVLYRTYCAGGVSGCHLKLAKAGTEALKNSTAGTLGDVMNFIGLTSVLSTLSLETVTIGLRGEGQILGVGDIIIPYFKTVADTYLWIYFLEIITDFVIKVAPLVFPMFVFGGLLMRLLPWYRRLGGLLVALGFALYYVFPIPFLITSHIMAKTCGVRIGMPQAKAQELMAKYQRVNIVGMEDLLKPVSEPLKKKVEKILHAPNLWAGLKHGGISFLIAALNLMVGAITSIPQLFLILGKIILSAWILKPLIISSAFLVTVVFFNLFFALVLGVAATRDISVLLGGDTEIGGLTRLL